MTTRAFAATDAAAVADMMNALEVFDGCDPYFTEAEIRGYLTGWLKDAARDSRLLFAPDGTLAAVAMSVAPPPGGSLADTFGGVHPQWRGRGLGRELLAWQLARIAEMHAEQAPGLGWHIDTGMNVRDRASTRLFERFGFTPVRWFFEMNAPTAEPPAASLPDGLRSVPYTDDLLDRVYRAEEESFADHWGFEHRELDDWTGLTVGMETFRPALSRIAFDGDEVAGLVLAYEGADNRLSIGQVGTLRAWRKRGVASALIVESLAAASAAGMATAVLGVDADNPTGALRVYERLGFAVRAKFVNYRRPLD